jgi:hypothetical protein
VLPAGDVTFVFSKGSSKKTARLPLPVTYERLCATVEKRFREFAIEDFELRTDPKGDVLASPWRLDRCNGSHIDIHVSSHCDGHILQLQGVWALGALRFLWSSPQCEYACHTSSITDI